MAPCVRHARAMTTILAAYFHAGFDEFDTSAGTQNLHGDLDYPLRDGG